MGGLSKQDSAAIKSSETLTEKLQSAYSAQTDNFLKYGNDMLALTAAYWTNITSMQATALGAMAVADARFSKFVAENPTIKNIGIVVWTVDGADWNPTADENFMQTARISAIQSSIPTFIAPQFKINVLVKVDKKGGATATAEGLTQQAQQAGI
jgi:hypothetical protein